MSAVHVGHHGGVGVAVARRAASIGVMAHSP